MVKLREFFNKYFIHIIPINQRFFIKVRKPGTKITKENIILNYIHHSPYKSGDIIFFKDKTNIYIWFTKEKLQGRKIFIPEGFLIYKNYAPKLRDAIITKKLGNGYGIIITKNRTITAQLFKNSLTKKDLELLEKEHSLKNAELINVNETKDYNFTPEILRFFINNFDHDFKKTLSYIYEEIKLPVIIFLLLINIFDLFTFEYISTILKNKEKKLKVLEKHNEKVIDKFNILERESDFFRKFSESELAYPSIYTVLSTISKIMIKNNSIIKEYHQYGNQINMLVISSSPSSIINDLSDTNYFSSIQIINVSQYVGTNKEIANINLLLKRKIKNG